jgi:hypothetical protein
MPYVALNGSITDTISDLATGVADMWNAAGAGADEAPDASNATGNVTYRPTTPKTPAADGAGVTDSGSSGTGSGTSSHLWLAGAVAAVLILTK